MVDDKKNKKEKKGSGELKKKIEHLENEVKEYRDQFARALADYKNLEKRFDEERFEFVKFANKDLLIRLIPALDALFLAAKYTSDEGVRLTAKTVIDSLAEVGAERVIVEGEEFDPQTMEAVATEDGEEGKVIEEVRPGFILNGKLLRPAHVKVGKRLEN